MDHRTKCKSQNQKASRKKNMGTFIYNLDKTQKALTMKKKLINWISPKLKYSVHQKVPLKNTNWEKYLQCINLTNVSYLLELHENL